MACHGNSKYKFQVYFEHCWLLHVGSLEANADIGHYLIRIILVRINICERKCGVRESRIGAD